MSKKSPQQIIDRYSQEAPVNLIGIAGSLDFLPHYCQDCTPLAK